MKKILWLLMLAFITLFFSKCDDSGINSGSENQFVISGTITGWALGTKTIKGVIYDSLFIHDFTVDSSTINPDGSFTLKPKDPPENFMRLYDPWDDSSCNNNVIINVQGLKWSNEISINVYNDTGMNIGSISLKNFDSIPVQGSFWRNYNYFSQDAEITGNSTCIFTYDTLFIKYMLSGLKKGWNKTIDLDYIITNTYSEYHYTTSEPDGGKWYFKPSPFKGKH